MTQNKPNRISKKELEPMDLKDLDTIESSDSWEYMTLYRACPSNPRIVKANLTHLMFGYFANKETARRWIIENNSSNPLYNKYGGSIIEFLVLVPSKQEALDFIELEDAIWAEDDSPIKIVEARVIEKISPSLVKNWIDSQYS
jgi:hypothetical protein